MANRSLGSLTIDLIAKIGGWTDGLSKAERELDKRTKRMNKMAYDFGRSFGASIKSAVTGFLAFAGVSVSIGAVVSSLKSAIDRADELRDASIRLGVGVDVLSKWSYAAKQTGTDIDGLNKGLKLLAKNASEALDPKSDKAKLFDALGISKDDLTDLTTLVPKVADAFKQLPDGPQKAAVAMELFGKSGADLIEFLNQGSDGLKTFGDRAQQLGIVISQDTANAADEFNDKLDDLKTAFTGLSTQVDSDLLPQLTKLVDWAVDFVSDGTKTKAITDGLTSAMEDLGNAADDIGALIGALQSLQSELVKAAIAGGQLRDSLPGAESVRGVQDFAKNHPVLGALFPLLGVAGNLRKLEVGRQFSNVQGNVRSSDQRSTFANVVGGVNTGSQQAALNRVLGAFSGGGGGSKKGGRSAAEKAAEDAKKLAEAQAKWHEQVLDMAADIAGPVEQANRDYEKQLKDLNDAYAEGKVRQEDYGKAKDLLAQKRDAEIKQIKDEAAHQWDDLIAQLNGPLAQAENDHIQRLKEIQDLGEKAGETAQQIADAKAIETAAYEKTSAAIKEQMDAMANPEAVRFLDEFRYSAVDALTDIVTGAKSAKDALKDFFDNLAAMVTRMIAERWIESLFGKPGTTGANTSGGNFFGSLIGMLFGGGKASGGWAMPNTMYEVNERGFEMASVGGRDYLLTGDSPVNITPNHMLGGSGMTQVNNFNYAAPYDQRTAQQTAQRVAFETRRASSRNN
jgi:hypothetical protein